MCTRAILDNNETFVNEKKVFLTGRNMDWSERFNTNLWAFPRGILRKSMPQNGFTWNAAYKSVAACETLNNPQIDKCHKGSTTDGINEKGLVVNTLWFAEADYGTPKEGEKVLSMGIWGQYMLDNYASVKEAINDWVKNKYRIVTFEMPSSENYDDKHRNATQHISLSDSNGNSAIFEYYAENGSDDVKLHITTNIKDITDSDHVLVQYEEDCNVMTNSPIYSQQKKLNYYWQWQWSTENNDAMAGANNSSKTHTLPGTSRAPDRFSRVAYYLDQMDRPKSYNEWIGQAFSLMRTASVPLGFRPDVSEPNISNTLWTTVADHANRRYYFQSTDFPNLLWVDLDSLDLEESNTILELPINNAFEDGKEYIGNVTEIMNDTEKEVDYFQFLLE